MQVIRVEVLLRKLPKALDGLSIVQLSDMHVGPLIGGEFVRRVVDVVNSLSVDLVAITGDLVDGSVADLARELEPLSGLRSTFGSYFVTGNHEYHAGAPEWCDFLNRLGSRVLRNERVEIERDGARTYLAGVDDYEAHFPPGGLIRRCAPSRRRSVSTISLSGLRPLRGLRPVRVEPWEHFPPSGRKEASRPLGRLVSLRPRGDSNHRPSA